MLATVSLTLACFFTLAGCISLALSLDRNWKNVTGETLVKPVKKSSRRMGWILLSLALSACIARDGVGFAALMWPLLITIMSFIVAMTLSFWPELLRSITRFY